MPQIRVTEKVHKKVAKIADGNFRGMGDQVAFWAAKECEHPAEMRVDTIVSVAPFENGKAENDTALPAFLCKQCGRIVVKGSDAELSKKLDQLVSA